MGEGFERSYNELVQTLYDKNLKIKHLEKENKELKNELDWVKIQLKCINEHITHLYNLFDGAHELVVLDSLKKDCQKMHLEGDGCFECRYSKEGTECCCIGEPYKWDLSEIKED